MSIDYLSVELVKAARTLLKWKQEDLARASGVSYPTIARLEAATGKLGGRKETIAKIAGAIERAGVIFIPENGEGAGVRLKKPRH